MGILIILLAAQATNAECGYADPPSCGGGGEAPCMTIAGYITCNENAVVGANICVIINSTTGIYARATTSLTEGLYGVEIPSSIGDTVTINVTNGTKNAINSTTQTETGVVQINVDLCLPACGDGIYEYNENSTNCPGDCQYCDFNKDGLIINDWNDLIYAYKCFLGIKTCDRINYQDWVNMNKEYQCFIGMGI